MTTETTDASPRSTKTACFCCLIRTSKFQSKSPMEPSHSAAATSTCYPRSLSIIAASDQAQSDRSLSPTPPLSVAPFTEQHHTSSPPSHKHPQHSTTHPRSRLRISTICSFSSSTGSSTRWPKLLSTTPLSRSNKKIQCQKRTFSLKIPTVMTSCPLASSPMSTIVALIWPSSPSMRKMTASLKSTILTS